MLNLKAWGYNIMARNVKVWLDECFQGNYCSTYRIRFDNGYGRILETKEKFHNFEKGITSIMFVKQYNKYYIFSRSEAGMWSGDKISFETYEKLKDKEINEIINEYYNVM